MRRFLIGVAAASLMCAGAPAAFAQSNAIGETASEAEALAETIAAAIAAALADAPAGADQFAIVQTAIAEATVGEDEEDVIAALALILASDEFDSFIEYAITYYKDYLESSLPPIIVPGNDTGDALQNGNIVVTPEGQYTPPS